MLGLRSYTILPGKSCDFSETVQDVGPGGLLPVTSLLLPDTLTPNSNCEILKRSLHGGS